MKYIFLLCFCFILLSACAKPVTTNEFAASWGCPSIEVERTYTLPDVGISLCTLFSEKGLPLEVGDYIETSFGQYVTFLYPDLFVVISSNKEGWYVSALRERWRN